MHSVPIGDRGSDIDHVVIGAAGVFTVNTKSHEDARIWVGSKRLLVNGQKTDHLRNSRFEAQRVVRELAISDGLQRAVNGNARGSFDPEIAVGTTGPEASEPPPRNSPARPIRVRLMA